MLEIEAKIKVDDLESVAQQLSDLGARHLANLVQGDVYYFDADGRLAKSGCGLRLRSETADGKTVSILTFKGARQDGVYKTRPEYETTVADGAVMVKILEGLGLEAVLTVAKNRRMWEMDGCDVCLDSVAELGCFVEVEGENEAAIKKVLTRLGLADRPHTVEGYAAMMAKKNKTKGNL